MCAIRLFVSQFTHIPVYILFDIEQLSQIYIRQNSYFLFCLWFLLPALYVIALLIAILYIYMVNNIYYMDVCIRSMFKSIKYK